MRATYDYEPWLLGRALKALAAAGHRVGSMKDLRSIPDADLLRACGIGRKSMQLLQRLRTQSPDAVSHPNKWLDL